MTNDKKRDSLGDRMKRFERDFSFTLTRDFPVLMRLDGKAFHTYTKGLDRPFDVRIIAAMWEVAKVLCSEIQGAKIAYVQSDEISILIKNRDFEGEPWFGNKVQKMVSVAAGIASGVMTEESPKVFGTVKRACFDARVWAVPAHEVCNALLWRQQDWSRNSIQMLARSLYSHKQCQNKNNSDLREMCFQKGENWNDLPVYLRRGACIVRETYHAGAPNEPPVTRHRWVVDKNIPIFTQDRNYIDHHLVAE